MVGLYIILICYVILSICGFAVLLGAHLTTQDKIEDIHNFLHDIYSHYTDPTEGVKEEDDDDESEEESEDEMKQLNNVFAIVDDVLDGNIELEDIGKEDEE